MNATSMALPVVSTGTEFSGAMRCFPRPPVACTLPASTWLERWYSELGRRCWHLGSAREEALAQLIPLLLCGEQSAQQVFSQCAPPLGTGAQAPLLRALARIEQEEAVHEHALQALAASLPAVADAHRRKRRAQRFYAALSQRATLAEQFGRIEALDSGVCRIMHSLAHASWHRSHPLHFLFEAIKTDEARHVGVSRRYARALGLSARERQQQRALVGTRMVAFLQADGAAFDCLGVDPDALFQHLSCREALQ